MSLCMYTFEDVDLEVNILFCCIPLEHLLALDGLNESCGHELIITCHNSALRKQVLIMNWSEESDTTRLHRWMSFTLTVSVTTTSKSMVGSTSSANLMYEGNRGRLGDSDRSEINAIYEGLIRNHLYSITPNYQQYIP